MALTLTWDDVLLRLVLAIVAGMVLGLDRGERGEPAGMRTTALVSLAAAAAMVAGNLLLPTTGRTSDSFVSLDVMRLPLGILSGMGFIGAGAILKRGETVQGLTTAATLWCATVIGICIGAGLIALGALGALAALLLLSGVKLVERQLPRYRRAKLAVTANGGRAPDIDALRQLAGEARLHVRGLEIVAGDSATLEMSVVWRVRGEGDGPPAFVAELGRRFGITSVVWET